jgi:hypothetical protein
MADSKKDSGASEVQAIVNEAEDRGFLGDAVDETPREHYTLAGVVAGKPTPETSRD